VATITERPVDQARPYQAYATIMGVFAGGLALAGGAARLPLEQQVRIRPD